MIEVTCFHCGQTVLISPDVIRCSECGANLRRLIDSEQAINYFYTRASGFADAGNLVHAVQEVQRGVTFYPCAELNLLGAILARRLNRVDQMRQFVAAVPVDSPLRSEAEWLLRASQSQSHVPEAVPTDADLLPRRAEPDRRGRSANPVRIQPVAWALLAALLALGGWWGWQQLPPDWAERIQVAAAAETTPLPPAASTLPPSPAPETAPADAPLDAAPAALPATATASPALLLPTPTIAPDLASAPTAAQPVAAENPGLAAIAAASETVDLAGLLRGEGRDDLAALPVQARRVGGRIVLEGTVETAEQRTELERYVRLLPESNDISLVNVRVRLPATYTVREGDSLWAISMALYGAPDMVEEIYAANRGVMSSPNALSVGMVLAVPEKE